MARKVTNVRDDRRANKTPQAVPHLSVRRLQNSATVLAERCVSNQSLGVVSPLESSK